MVERALGYLDVLMGPHEVKGAPSNKRGGLGTQVRKLFDNNMGPVVTWEHLFIQCYTMFARLRSKQLDGTYTFSFGTVVDLP